ncbi:Orotate phosphoribosyltransferase [Candidatus Magnetaquicoccaceae bacterium FCR-1]|uniref:Orotate phosphoribosyltransferase n=1 Tax=Candidatus Magnetaquiglobus chichijimensis TaxID=3141448 RepID=A0ABQ0C492_9PROT
MTMQPDSPAPSTLAERFLTFAIQAEVLRFGTFQTKAGRSSPYFFNAGLFHDGERLSRLGSFYADTLVASGLGFDMLFGPAYKGIPLAAATTIALSRDHGLNLPFAYNRKEIKDHGEGGNLIGAPLRGRVVVIDDVISAGTSIRESVEWIQKAGATLAGVVIALDRQERGTGTTSATQEIQATHDIPVIAIARLEDLIGLLARDATQAGNLEAIQGYRALWGV